MTTTVAIVAGPLFTFAAVMTGGRVNAAQLMSQLRQSQPVNAVFNWLQPQTRPGAVAIAGNMAAPAPPTMGEPAPLIGKIALPPVANAPASGVSKLQCDVADQGQTK
jgi:hypothetical protein